MNKTKLIRITSIFTGIFCIALLSLISLASACMEETAEAGSQNMMTGAAIISNTASISGFLGLIQKLLVIIVLLLLIIFLVKKISKK